MNATAICILFAILFLYIPNGVFGKVVSPKLVYLTFQADNGSFRQVTEMDGTITIYLKQLDVIKVNTILLNGTDVTLKLVKNHFSLPELTKNTTLDITFEVAPTEITYNTISFQTYSTGFEYR
jgi:hypothetical protein